MTHSCGGGGGSEASTPEAITNRPGLEAIAYRVGTHASFFEALLARLSSLWLDVPSADGKGGTHRINPLRNLTTRDPADPAIALLDGWAVVADVLSFYQERIANEGYLRTATERRSVVELAQLVGYRLRPGLASSVHLAFTVAAGFQGNLPIGTRAQSLPGEGEKPQFFETGEPLFARDDWNLLKPSQTRPQVFTPPRTDKKGNPVVTGADVVDTVYLEGIAANLKTGDALLFTFGEHIDPVARNVETINAQAQQNRTEVILAQRLPTSANFTSADSISILQVFISKANYLFPGSDIAQDVVTVLSTLSHNITEAGLVRGLTTNAIAQIQQKQDIAIKRSFTRIVAWTGHVLQFLRKLGTSEDSVNSTLLETDTSNDNPVQLKVVPSSLETSPLANLGTAIGQLALAPSQQPANAQRLARSVAQSFSPQSDTAPRLLAAFNPAVAGTLYQAWANIKAPPGRVEVLVARVKASFFASSYTGPAQITSTASTTTFPNPPKISTAWGSLFSESDPPSLPTLPLDSTYGQIKRGSWLVVDRPALNDKESSTGRVVSYHKVIDVRISNMDTLTGFAAKVTLVDIDPPWQPGPLNETENENDLEGVESTPVLRETVIYTQTESLTLAEEPLDTDLEKDSIGLDGVLHGIEAGRLVIVSGNRTDVPNVSTVTASELAMVAAVAQGQQEPYSAEFTGNFIPFINDPNNYITPPNANGDRLWVGYLAGNTWELIKKLTPPTRPNQKYREQIQLAPGVYANAYVPTEDEKDDGEFRDFEGLLVDPVTGRPYDNGIIPIDDDQKSFVFAWRISPGNLQTLLTFAQPLAYKYDRSTVTIYGNVVKATEGQTVGEVLGNGEASVPFQTFSLHQKPLTFVSAPTLAGGRSTLNVRVNDLDWQEQRHLTDADSYHHVYTTDTDDSGQTTITFGNGANGSRLPSGNANVKATYRYGVGKAGNVNAWQIKQLATRPAGAQDVINPLPATGGADPDNRDQARRNAPLSVTALDRLVSVKDYADFATTYAGVGKASAARITDGRRQTLHLTIAGVDDIPIDRNSDLYVNLVQSLQQFGDPYLSLQVSVRRIKLLVISAHVKIASGFHWEAVEPVLRSALLKAFSFERRQLGQSAFQSEVVKIIQNTVIETRQAVVYTELKVFDSVADDITTNQLATLGQSLGVQTVIEASLARPTPQSPLPSQRIQAAELVFLSPQIPATLLLTEI